MVQVASEPFGGTDLKPESSGNTQALITMILNGLPWKQTEIILSFLRLHPSTVFHSFVDHDGHSISSEGFLPSVVDIMVI